MTAPDNAGELRPQVDKNSVEYKIILELEEYTVLRCLTYTDFHGQEIGEDPEFDKLCEREKKARKALLAKIESLVAEARQSGYRAALEKVNQEVIGGTESLDDCLIERHICDKATRNVFRAEQRKRLSALRRGEGEGLTERGNGALREIK